jgi:acetyltransferase-like isoleucine patch superfamily enzyme
VVGTGSVVGSGSVVGTGSVGGTGSVRSFEYTPNKKIKNQQHKKRWMLWEW